LIDDACRYQGGPMSGEEAVAFENSDLFTISLKIREWDERAKEQGVLLDSLDKYKHLARQLLSTYKIGQHSNRAHM
jgi:predicted HD phosphohydrolase